jgi:hypothetical protein
VAEHSIYGATAPAALTGFNDGGGSLWVATRFYKIGSTAAWTCVGARIYIPAADVAVWNADGLVNMRAQIRPYDTGGPMDWSSPDRTSTFPGPLVAGWNEIRWATPLTFNSALDAAAPQQLHVGYKSASGTRYSYNAGTDTNGAKQAVDGSPLYEHEHAGAGRSSNTFSGFTAARYAIDWIVSDGVAVATTGSMAASTPKVTGSITGASASTSTTGSLGASTPRATAALTGAVRVTGSLTASTPRTRAQLADTVTPTIAQENANSTNVFDKAYWWEYPSDAIPGFTRSTYYLPGQTAQFSVNFSTAYTVDLYRLGHYGSAAGAARRVAQFAGTTATQPAPAVIPNSNGAVTCEAWSTNVTWPIPADATPGWYWLFMKSNSTTQFGGILFCVSDKLAKQPVLVVASEATWGAAYNGFGANNVYGDTIGIGNINNRALCSSLDKPVISRDNVPQTHFFNGELATLRFLERFGFNVGYTTCEQINNDPSVMDGRQLVIFSGHNEYISQRIRDKTKAVIAAGTNVANFAANDMFWRTAYGGTTFPTGATTTSTGRVMWCRKDTMAGPAAIRSGGAGTPFSTQADWTGTWQDTRWTLREPSNALLGDRFIANGIRADSVKVPFAMKSLPIWRNCPGVQALTTGQEVTFAAGTAGMEWDMPDTVLPSVSLSASTVDLTGNSSDVNGENYNQNGTYTHAFQMAANGPSRIFNANTTQWGWVLDNLHLRSTAPANTDAMQGTLNVLYDLGAVGSSSLIGAATLFTPTKVSSIDTAYGITTTTTVPATRSTGWAVAVSPVTVASTRANGWAVAASLTTTRAASWAVSVVAAPTTVATTRTAPWVVAASTASSRASSFTVRALTLAFRTSTWAVTVTPPTTKVGASCASSWNVAYTPGVMPTRRGRRDFTQPVTGPSSSSRRTNAYLRRG